MTTPNIPLSRQDYALNLLEQIKAEIENNDVNDAALQLAQLTEHIAEWQNSENLKTARVWLDEALQGDLLAFDAGTARDYLKKWTDAADKPDENPELADYRERVEKRAKQKNEALLIRGVMSHSDEILSQAKSLESGSEAPAPDFMLRQYYGKAKNIVLSAQAEHDKNPDLEQLVQRVERLYNNKEVATTIFPMALESKKFSNALNNLEQMPDDFLVPRFTALESASDDIHLQYQGMIQIPIARVEITTLAKTWASKVVTDAIATSQRYLDAHEPQEAVDELDIGTNVEKFLDADQKAILEQTKSNATTQLRNREKAEERAKKALELVENDPLATWDEYAAAYQLYQWADGLDEARQAAVKGMRSRLTKMAREADVAFHEARDMARVQEICSRAKTQFSNKDASLNELLQQFDEFEEMIRSYQEYITTGNEIITKVKVNLQDDAVAANDLLTQIESYPDFVLEAFDELYDLRVLVNQRLNSNQAYNELYKALFIDHLPDITRAIQETNAVGDQHPGDERFKILENWLKYHMAFISAVKQFERGAHEQAIGLIAPVLSQPQHPDYEAAQKMSQAIQAAGQEDNADTGENGAE